MRLRKTNEDHREKAKSMNIYKREAHSQMDKCRWYRASIAKGAEAYEAIY